MSNDILAVDVLVPESEKRWSIRVERTIRDYLIVYAVLKDGPFDIDFLHFGVVKEEAEMRRCVTRAMRDIYKRLSPGPTHVSTPQHQQHYAPAYPLIL